MDNAHAEDIIDFNKICRTCISQTEVSPISGMKINGIDANALLDYTVQIDVRNSDKLPQQLCMKCIKILYQFFEFKLRTHENENMFKTLLEKSEKSKQNVPIKLEDSYPIQELITITINSDSDDEEERTSENGDEEERTSENGDKEDKEDEESANSNEVSINSPLVTMKNSTEQNESELDVSSAVASIEEITFKEEYDVLDEQKSNVDENKDVDDEDTTIPKHLAKVRRCSECLTRFKSNELLRKHLRETQHSLTKRFPCEICNKYFLKRNLPSHMRTHTKDRLIQCSVCCFYFNNRPGNFRRHMMTHTGERDYLCNVCGKGFIQRQSWVDHEKTHIFERDKNALQKYKEDFKFTCEICGKCFRFRQTFKTHMERHGSNIVPTKRLPNPYNCETCGRGFEDSRLLTRHQETQHRSRHPGVSPMTNNKNELLCRYCGKGFKFRSYLETHLRLHTGEKPFICKYCNKTFSYQSGLRVHLFIHTGEKPYTCKLCNRSFTQNNQLVYHLRLHRGEKPYMCPYCGKKFTQNGNLTVHIRTHTGVTPYKCQVCGKGFRDSSSRKRHVFLHHKKVEDNLKII